MCWFDNKHLNLISSYVAVEPIDSVRRYDEREKTYIDVPRPNVVKVYNTYMGGIDKLDMMCALYKDQIKKVVHLHLASFCDIRSSKFMFTLPTRPNDTW